MSELSLLSDLRELIKFIYKLQFLEDERYGLESQMRRAAISVSLNIREGNVFEGKKKLQFFKIALGSLNEVDECMIISKELKLLNDGRGVLNIDQDIMFNLNWRKEHYWKCINKLKKLIESIKSK